MAAYFSVHFTTKNPKPCLSPGCLLFGYVSLSSKAANLPGTYHCMGNPRHPQSVRTLYFSLGKKYLNVAAEILILSSLYQFFQSLSCWDSELSLWQLMLFSPLGPHFIISVPYEQQQRRTVLQTEHLLCIVVWVFLNKGKVFWCILKSSKASASIQLASRSWPQSKVSWQSYFYNGGNKKNPGSESPDTEAWIRYEVCDVHPSVVQCTILPSLTQKAVAYYISETFLVVIAWMTVPVVPDGLPLHCFLLACCKYTSRNDSNVPRNTYF